MQPKAGEITALLGHVRDGDSSANDALIALLYDELRRVARGLMSRERHRVTLQPTALVHEAYLRLAAGSPSGGWNSRAHFLAAAARATRRILIERARRRHRQRRGGNLERVTLDEGSASYEVRRPQGPRGGRARAGREGEPDTSSLSVPISDGRRPRT